MFLAHHVDISCSLLPAGRRWRGLRTGVAVTAGILLAGWSGMAQTAAAGALDPLQAGNNGFHIYSLSLSDGYYSSPQATPGQLPGAALPADMGYSAGASLGFNYLHSGSGISLFYAPSYNGFAQNPKLNALNHTFSIAIHNRRDPGRKWHVNFSANGGVSTPTQFLFAPTTLGQLADTPATFDDLSQGVVAGQFNNDQIASLMTGAALPESPAALVLYGNYFLSTGVQGVVSYAPTSRFTVSTTISGMRMQVLPRYDSSSYVIPGTWAGTASIQIGYSLSERTQLQGTLSTNRTITRIEDLYTSTASASLNRILSRRWFADIDGGTSVSTPVRGGSTLDRKPHPVGSGSIGFKTETQTLMAQAGRQLSDPYGLGAASNLTATFAWSWRPLGSNWSALLTGTWIRMTTSNLVLTNSAIGRISLNRSLSHHTVLSLAYSYMSSRGAFAAELPVKDLDAAMLTFYWLPGGDKPHEPPAATP